MSKTHYPLLLLVFLTQVAVAQKQWAWMNGTQSAGTNGIYGTQGTPDPANSPGSRVGASSWRDTDGNIWLFGGRGRGESGGNGYLNDLWKFNPSNNQWTWVGGNKNTDQHGEYGDKGTPSPSNQPGARQNAVHWRDNQGNLWLFGGAGVASRDDRQGFLNDLWKYSPSTNQWTWVSGTDREDREGKYGDRLEPSTDNYPGGRYMATGWTDADDKLWLFGGRGYSSDNDDVSDLNDLWKYSPATNEWTWMKGDDSELARVIYGLLGLFSDDNTPGGRRGSTGWVDKQGTFWLFGGSSRSNVYNDLWKYDRQNNRWAWINGSTNPNQEPEFEEEGVPDPNGNPGSRTLATGAVDAQGDLLLFGGSGYGGNQGPNPLNSLWKYTIASNAWTFMKGEISIHPTAVYGSRTVPATENQPGGMSNSTAWNDAQGNLWIFGGESSEGILNQTWKFSLGCAASIIGNISPASTSICNGGSKVLTATGGTSYEWQRNGVTIAGQTGATLTVTQPGTYTALITKNLCTAPASNSAVVRLEPPPKGNISPATSSICEGGSQVLTATGGSSYQWKRNGVAIAGQSGATITATQAGTYSVVITNNAGCSAPASNTAEVELTTTPNGNITPATASICVGESQVLTATGGTSYEWMRDGTIIEGEASETLTVTTAGTYSVKIINGSCSGPASNTAEVTVESAVGTRYADVIVTPNVPAPLSARAIGVAYEWVPPTGLDNPTSPTPMVTTNTDREYVVLIDAGDGCPVTDTVMVRVNTPPQTQSKLFVPTAFTPNGNGANDRLRPLGNISSIDYFRVYNRWGNLVFQTTDPTTGWDGRYKGVEQPSDTYTWVLSGKTRDGQQIKQSGKTLLIR